jgi:hypothetical protein
MASSTLNPAIGPSLPLHNLKPVRDVDHCLQIFTSKTTDSSQHLSLPTTPLSPSPFPLRGGGASVPLSVGPCARGASVWESISTRPQMMHFDIGNLSSVHNSMQLPADKGWGCPDVLQ